MLNAADAAIKGGGAPPPSPVPLKLKTEAQRLPEPVRSMMDTLGDSSARISQMMVRAEPERRGALAGRRVLPAGDRRPLSDRPQRDARRDAGRLRAAVRPRRQDRPAVPAEARAYVDTTTRPWRFRPVEGAPLGTDIGSLTQFQRAAGDPRDLLPGRQRADADADDQADRDGHARSRQFILDIDGQIVRYDHGPQIPTPVVWPGPRGTMQVRVQVDPPGSGTTFGSLYEGPWALFRLFDRVSFEPIANSQTALPRHLRHRRPQGRLRGHGEQRAQSVPAARAARLPVPDGPVTSPRASRSRPR